MRVLQCCLFILIISLCACKSEPQKDALNIALVNFLKQGDANDTIKAVLVIPRAGCGGCIGNALIYARKNIDKLHHVKIILTDIGDKKLINLELGKDFLRNKNILMDTSEILTSHFDTPYPTVYYFDNSMKITRTVNFESEKTDITEL
jgi:thioredoxin-related protein